MSRQASALAAQGAVGRMIRGHIWAEQETATISQTCFVTGQWQLGACQEFAISKLSVTL